MGMSSKGLVSITVPSTITSIYYYERKIAVGARVVSTNDDKENTSSHEEYSLFPRKFLDTILEATTLHGVTYNS